MLTHTLSYADESLVLHAEGGIHWPRRDTLIIADTHFGKDAHFRSAGLAVPCGTLSEDLARLDRLLARTGAQRLVILGDVIHARPAPAADWVDRIAEWRARYPRLAWLAIAGNHDAGWTPPPAWRLDWHTAPINDPPFRYQHEPATGTGNHVLAGHWHPVMRLRGTGERVRLPVFAVGVDCFVLPAFGSFTGGAEITDDAFQGHALVDDQVIPLPMNRTANVADPTPATPDPTERADADPDPH
ncbi:MAG: ligase-associated DNA damage response endonuclease PdeM [Ectothiorhodospiraceae bacterium]